MKILQLFCRNFRIIMYTINIEIIKYLNIKYQISISNVWD